MMKHIRLLPVLMLVSALTFAVRMGDFVTGLSRSGSAYAQQEVQANPPPMPATQDKSATPTAAPPLPKMPMADTPAPAKDAAKDAGAKDDGKTDAKSGKWKDAGDNDADDSDVKDSLYKDLAARRADLDKREKDLQVREALLKAGEKEVDQKLTQLTALRDEIKGLMKTEDDAEKARIDSLVKIYEGMKPEDAARIFNTLDMETVMKIMSSMSERKSGPVLAAMTPERARQVTQQLAQQKQLPDIPPP